MDFAHIKKQLIAQMLHSFETDLAALLKAAHEAREAATHEENIAEDKYDTRGLEASYLAGAQARRAQELEELVYFYKNITTLQLPKAGSVSSPCLLNLSVDETKSWYFLIPKGSSQPIAESGKQFIIITSPSPLGQELLGRECGEDFDLKIAGKSRHFVINEIH